MEVLIVDDEKDILELLDYHLIKEGYKTMKASDGKEALKVAKDFLPDLVLLDLMKNVNNLNNFNQEIFNKFFN